MNLKLHVLRTNISSIHMVSHKKKKRSFSIFYKPIIDRKLILIYLMRYKDNLYILLFII